MNAQPEVPAASDPRPRLREVRTRLVELLRAAGVDGAETDADLLAGHVLGLSRGGVQAALVTDRVLDPADAVTIASLGERRARREPLQHVIGVAPFRSLELEVGPGVFVPRPETETVAQLAIDALRALPDAAPLAVDLGTGSGALALALATEVPHSRVVAVERSPEAFAWARRNVARTGAANVELVLGDLADALPHLDGRAGVVVSNPPYVPVGEMARDPEVRLHDPDAALYAGADGLDVIRVLARRAHALLRPGGVLVVEHFETQSAAIAALLAEHGWRAVAHHRDLTGRDRATTAVR